MFAAYCYAVCVCVCVSVTRRYSAKTAVLIEMSFGTRARVGHRNHVLDGGSDHQGKGVIFFLGGGNEKALRTVAARSLGGIVARWLASTVLLPFCLCGDDATYCY